MTIKLTKQFVGQAFAASKTYEACAEHCRNAATGLRAVARMSTVDMKAKEREANSFMELARRIDANNAQRCACAHHQHQLWD